MRDVVAMGTSREEIVVQLVVAAFGAAAGMGSPLEDEHLIMIARRAGRMADLTVQEIGARMRAPDT